MLIRKRLVSKSTWYPSSRTLRFGCQDRPVTGNVHGWSLSLGSFLLDWLAACHLKPSRGFVGALRTLVSSLVDTLHLGSKSSKLVMFHVTFANPTLEEWDGKSWKIRKPLFWAMVLLFIIIYIAGAESLWMWKLSESRWFLIIMSIASGDLSRYQEQ